MQLTALQFYIRNGEPFVPFFCPPFFKGDDRPLLAVRGSHLVPTLRRGNAKGSPKACLPLLLQTTILLCRFTGGNRNNSLRSYRSEKFSMSKTGFELNLFRKVCSLGILLALVVCTLHTPAVAQFFLKNQFPNLSFLAPVGLYRLNDGTGRICVLEQQGVIRIFPDDSTVTTPGTFLDIHDSVISGGELGLLGLAFHPQFATNGFFYVDYTRNNPLRTVISRFHVSNSNPDSNY